MKQKLNEEGLFDQSIKKPIPAYPEKIAVVTSPTGAAIRDIIQVFTRRVSYCDLTVFPVRVQGETASAEIANAIQSINEIGDFDLIITGRGGGSIEDLWGFNEENVARAIYASDIPVISGVGHETDFTISDFVSDLRAPTPSAAAELAAVSDNELLGYLKALSGKLTESLRYRADIFRETLEAYRPQMLAGKLSKLSEMKRFELEVTRDKLIQSINNDISYKRQELMHTGRLLDQISPLKTLERGYSIAQNDKGHVIKSVSSVKAEDFIDVRVSDGT